MERNLTLQAFYEWMLKNYLKWHIYQLAFVEIPDIASKFMFVWHTNVDSYQGDIIFRNMFYYTLLTCRLVMDFILVHITLHNYARVFNLTKYRFLLEVSTYSKAFQFTKHMWLWGVKHIYSSIYLFITQCNFKVKQSKNYSQTHY